MTLPTDSKERKELPLWTFMFNYFPLAWLEVVRVAVAGNAQHENGADIRWDRSKSMDQLNTAARHQFDYGMGVKKDVDGRAHLAKAIWRLMAQLQLDEESTAVAPASTSRPAGRPAGPIIPPAEFGEHGPAASRDYESICGVEGCPGHVPWSGKNCGVRVSALTGFRLKAVP